MSSDPNPVEPSSSSGGDVVADRRAKLARIADELKIDPFGGRVDGLIGLADAAAKFDAGADEAHKANPTDDRRPLVKISGRIMLHRVMGNLIFMTVRDATGDLQVAVSKKAVDATSFQLAKLVDLGDIVVAQGPLAKTKTGEITVWATGQAAGTPLPLREGLGGRFERRMKKAARFIPLTRPSPNPSLLGRGVRAVPRSPSPANPSPPRPASGTACRTPSSATASATSTSTPTRTS